MLPKDVFARSLEFPKNFPDDTLDPENFFQFMPFSKGSFDYALSVASRFQLANVSDVHEYGLAVVEAKNAREASEKGVDPDPRRKYVGFYEFFAECIIDISFDAYNCRIKWKPENNQDAHFQVELLWCGIGGDKVRKKDRRAARTALFDGCFGPEVLASANEDEDLVRSIANLPIKPRPAP